MNRDSACEIQTKVSKFDFSYSFPYDIFDMALLSQYIFKIFSLNVL